MPVKGNLLTLVNVPNTLTTLRLCSAPLLLWLAWEGKSTVFVGVLIFSLLTDLIDGPVARWLGQVTEFGSRFDSLADAFLYLALPFCTLWLRPEFVDREIVYFFALIMGYVVPACLGFF
ncbi:MAG: CDP-alcohol phosphatidyltransferase family protein, partial [Planctomycetota bacterium]